MRRLLRLVAVVVLGAGLALAPAGLATAQSLDDFDIESFDAQWTLTRDADGRARLHVVETIVAVFPDFDQNKGFYRDIPEYRQGVRLQTSVSSVVDELGQPVPYTTEYYNDFFSVGLGDDSYVRGRQTYVITYDQVDVVQAFADTGVDEFYWDVNGTGWAQPFGRTSVTLSVDPSLVSALTGATACYTADECDEPLVSRPQDDGSVVFTAAEGDLAPNESLTVSIAFTTGTFVPGEIVIPPSGGVPSAPPTFWDTAGPFAVGGAGALFAVLAAVTQVSDRSRRTPASDIVVPQYTPPDGLNVMVAAYIAGRPERAFAAQIVSLAVRGHVRLLDHPADSTAPFEVELVNADGVNDLERKLLVAIFGSDLPSGSRIPLGSSNTALGRKLTGVYQAVDKRLRSDGYQGPARPTVLWTVLWVLALGVAIVAGIDVVRRFLGDGYPEFSFVALFVAIFTASQVWNRRSTVATLSAKGKRRNDYLLGMRDYMQLAEEDRIRVLQSPEGAERVNVDDSTAMVKLYEQLLPFAVIFGIEDRWSQELTVKAAAAAVPVTWWDGSSDFSSWRLNSTIQNIRRATPEPPRPLAAKQVNSASRGGWSSGSSSGGWSGSSGSSFSGGSSGGGFSGGGGGGGGGRGR